MDLENGTKNQSLITVELSNLALEQTAIHYKSSSFVSLKHKNSCDSQNSCGDVCHIVSTSPNGQLFYSGKTGEKCDSLNCICKHYYVEEESMKKFLKKAAQDIYDLKDLDEDPLINFKSKYKKYSICLIVMFLNVLLNLKDSLFYTFIDKENELHGSDKLADLRPVIITSLCINVIIQTATFIACIKNCRRYYNDNY